RLFWFCPAPWWSFDRGVKHSRDFCVNAVARRAGHDVASIDAFGRFSDQAEIDRLFQVRFGWNRKLGGVGHQLRVFETAFARCVDNLAICRRTARPIHFPSCGGRRDEHLASSRTSLPQHLPTASDTGTAASIELLEIRSRRGLHYLD